MKSNEHLSIFTKQALENRISKYSQHPILCDLTFYKKKHQNILHGKLIDESGSTVILNEVQDNMYACVLTFSHKLERKLRKLKNIKTAKKCKKGSFYKQHLIENTETVDI